MISFKEYLGEYRKAPFGEPLSVIDLSNLLNDLTNIKQLDITLPIFIDESSLIVYEYEVTHVHKLFVVAKRTINEESLNTKSIIGYMQVKNIYDDYWQVLSVEIYPKFANRGIGTEFYFSLISSGYKLMNGESLSPSSEMVWKKLRDKNLVSVYDIETKIISKDFEKVEKDNSINQRYFFITENKENVYHKMFCRSLTETLNYRKFLSNKMPRFPTFYGVERFSEDGEY